MRESYKLYATCLAPRLKKLRGGHTQAEFAELLGLKQAQYNRYETGKRLMPDKLLIMAADIAGASPEEVFCPEFAAEAHAAPGGPAAEVAVLLEMLEPEDIEDLYYFLKRKTEELAKRRKAEAKRMASALEKMRDLAAAG